MYNIDKEKYPVMLRDESIDDLLTILSPVMPIWRLDPLMIRSRRENITNRELGQSFDRLLEAGILVKDGSDRPGCLAKGPNWFEPEFIKSGKYS